MPDKSELERCRVEVDQAIAVLHQRVDGFTLREEQIEAIAERASNKAIDKMATYVYLEIGKGVVSKVFKIIGIIAVSMAIAFHDKWWPR